LDRPRLGPNYEQGLRLPERNCHPLPGQTAIAEYLDRATADINTAITCTKREIELLDEYRTRLTADVVTGKLDVCEAAALPEVDPLAADEPLNILDAELGVEGEMDPEEAKNDSPESWRLRKLETPTIPWPSSDI